MDIEQYVKAKGITVKLVRDRGFQLDSTNGWWHHAYVIRLSRPGTFPGESKPSGKAPAIETPEFDYKVGTGYFDGRPEDFGIEDMAPVILESLVSDATAYTRARNFEDFAADLGYDTDSRKAERIYFACGEIAKWLTVFLGGQREFDNVAEKIERL